MTDSGPRTSLPIEIIYSTRRRRTVQASIVNGVIQVRAPAKISKKELDATVATLVARLERRHRSESVDLEGRARRLARRFELPQPTAVVWAEQRSRWGSCTPSTGELRLSNRLAAWPPWVLDYVIVHELAHLVEFDHSLAFHALVDRYPLAERARGFLIAKSQGEEDTADTANTDSDDDLEEPLGTKDLTDQPFTDELFTDQLFTDEGSAGSVD